MKTKHLFITILVLVLLQVFYHIGYDEATRDARIISPYEIEFIGLFSL